MDYELLPENDLQELWEMSGRRKAALVYIEETEEYMIKKKMLIAMLGGDVDGIPVCEER